MKISFRPLPGSRVSELVVALLIALGSWVSVPARGAGCLNRRHALEKNREDCFRPLTGSRASEQVGGIVTKMVHGRFRPLTGSKVSEPDTKSNYKI